MGELNIALTNLSSIIEDIQNILKENLPPEDKKTFIKLLNNSRAAFTNFAGFASSEIKSLNETSLDASNNATILLDLQTIIRDIYEEKQATIQRISVLNSTKMKEIQFNSYFAQVNYYNVTIMKILVVSSILMMLNIFLYTRKYISDSIYTIISIIIITITMIVITKMIYSEYQRSNYNFDTFVWAKPK